MEKGIYRKPMVLNHQPIVFETLISCDPPNEPGEISRGNVPICVAPDNTWFPR